MSPKTPPSLEVPKLVLVDLLAYASSAAHIIGHLDDRHGSTALEQLSDHIDALVHGLCELLGEHRRTVEMASDDAIVMCRKGYVRGGAS